MGGGSLRGRSNKIKTHRNIFNTVLEAASLVSSPEQRLEKHLLLLLLLSAVLAAEGHLEFSPVPLLIITPNPQPPPPDHLAPGAEKQG